MNLHINVTSNVPYIARSPLLCTCYRWSFSFTEQVNTAPEVSQTQLSFICAFSKSWAALKCWVGARLHTDGAGQLLATCSLLLLPWRPGIPSPQDFIGCVKYESQAMAACDWLHDHMAGEHPGRACPALIDSSQGTWPPRFKRGSGCNGGEPRDHCTRVYKL